MLLVAPEQAEAVVDRLIEATDRLERFPNLGRSLEGYERTRARELGLDRYRIIYRTDGALVEIASVFDGSMDVETRLRKLLGDI